MEKIDREDYLILPNETMHEKYKETRRIQRLLGLPMALGAFFLAMAAEDLILDIFDLSDTGSPLSDITFFLSCAAGFVGLTFVLTENSDRHFKLTATDVAVQAALLVLTLLLGAESGQIFICLGFIAATVLVNWLSHPFILDIETMKQCPNFPFDTRIRENYLSGVSGERALKVIENSMNQGKVQSVGGEEFFEGEKKTYEPPKPDPAKNLQQRKQVWRQHDKADTGYTMDNLKNMHFDAPDEGELSGKELERELMKATAPNKPPEPPEEDFFQSSPVVWRTNKDGTTTMERRAPGSVPAGEKDSRTVLM